MNQGNNINNLLNVYQIKEEEICVYLNCLKQNNKTLGEIIDTKNDVYSLGNDVLYNLCKTNFEHKDNKSITAKVWLIGRSYAAAIERGKDRGNNISRSAQTFWNEMLDAMKESKIDDKLSIIQKYKEINDESLKTIMITHKNLIDIIPTEINKRSFASKYLHFHCPNAFFIFDSRANKAISHFVKKSKTRNLNYNNFDKTYFDFYLRCLKLKKYIKEKSEFDYLDCTPRQLDMILLDYQDNYFM